VQLKRRLEPLPTESDRIVFIIRTIGDYHAPRLLRFQQDLRCDNRELVIFETTDKSELYTHGQTRAPILKRSLNCERIQSSGTLRRFCKLVLRVLKAKPKAVFVLGYTDELSLAGLTASKLLRVPVCFLSDSKADDQPRTRVSEFVKKLLIRRFDGALVAGQRHREYFASLGLDKDRIEVGFDVVDNDYFAERAGRFRSKKLLLQRLGILPDRYVIVVSRFIQRKRVPLAIELYAASGLATERVKLLVIGDGPERDAVLQKINDFKLEGSVTIRSQVRNSMMPLFFAHAEAIMLVSEYDQWGLSINEAMTCGVPALVTARCGCAGEIVIDRVNGYVWDGRSVAEGAGMLRSMVLDANNRRSFAAASIAMMGKWNLARFSESARKLIGMGA
jgi:glycosyltransferase involved in cell wall biosynthesis